MSKPQDVVNFRRRIKIALVEAFGAECQTCHNKFPQSVFEFHHLIPSEKSFGLGTVSTTRSRQAYADEAKKCIMVCANCHRLIEYENLNISEIACSFNEDKYYSILETLSQENKDKANSLRKEASPKPDRQTLKEQIRTLSFTEIARIYGVSDASIRRWCKDYNLPHRVSDIKKIADEDWQKI